MKNRFVTFSFVLSSAFAFKIDITYANSVDSLFDLTLAELMQVRLVTAASGFEQKSQRAPASVTVISSEEWQAMGARFLSDVLVIVPGFHVGKPRVSFKHNEFTLRGLSGTQSSQIKLLIDGESMEYMQDGGLMNGFHLPLKGFKRIEVISGPGSAVYGADAFAGIINLVPYEHNEMPSTIGGRIGSFNTHDWYASNAFNIGNANVSFAVNYSRSDDDSNRIVHSDLQSIFDGIFSTSASLAPGVIDDHYEVISLLTDWTFEDISIDLYSWRNFDVGLGGGVAQALDQTGEATSSYDRLKVTYDFSDKINGSLQASFVYKDVKGTSNLTAFPAGAVLPIGADGNINFVEPVGSPLFEEGFIGTPSSFGKSYALNLTHLFKATDSQLIRWELGYQKQDFTVEERKNFGPGVINGTESVISGKLTSVTGTEFAYMPDVERSFYYLSVQDEWQVQDDILLTLGLRYDKYSDFGSTTNPRLGLIWHASKKIAVKFFAGSAFKAPSLIDLYTRNNPVEYGNAELRPETIDTLETGLNFEYLVNQDLIVSMRYFNYHAKDLIDTVPNAKLKGSVAENIGEQKGKGGEITLKWKPTTQLTIDMNYATVSAKDAHDIDITDIPTELYYLSANWHISEDWHWFVGSKWIKGRKRSLTDLRDTLADYAIVNSNIRIDNILPDTSLALSVNNLLDKVGREPSDGNIADDFPVAGRQLMLELAYTF